MDAARGQIGKDVVIKTLCDLDKDDDDGDESARYAQLQLLARENTMEMFCTSSVWKRKRYYQKTCKLEGYLYSSGYLELTEDLLN